MTIWDYIKRKIREIASLTDHIDTEDAAARIQGGIWFRGPNVWILAFSIVIASVGLNVNSTAVIIGAMLISPLMGPIIGVGLSLGTNDTGLLGASVKNLLVMVAISLVASFLFFLISPLELVNPTELEARTAPTIYDVLIALFGGLAGILENCRKERGTVLSGVAIATALMPPLCTAGYGLAHWDAHFFFGAMYLFLINTVFITLATAAMVLLLKFHKVEAPDPAVSRKRRRVVMAVTLAVMVPSIWSAFVLVWNNDFERNVRNFVAANRTFDHGYIYDYQIRTKGARRSAEIFLLGPKLTPSVRADLLASAKANGLKESQLTFSEHAFGPDMAAESERLMEAVYEIAEAEMGRKDGEIAALREQLESVSAALDSLSRRVSGDSVAVTSPRLP